MFAGPPSAASSAALVRTNLQVDAALNDRSAPVLRPVQWPPAGEGPRAKNRRSAIAEADGNRTRQPTLAGSPVLKFGDGRVVGCDQVISGAAQCRSARPFVPSGVVL